MTDNVDDDKNTPDLSELQAQLAEATKGIEALKAKNDELIAEKRKVQQTAKEREEAAIKAAEEAAAKAGDVDALTKSWEAKLSKREQELAEEIKARDSRLLDLTVNAEARRIAADLAVPGSADVLLPHIKARLQYDNGKVTVLDAEGKPSASTVDELAKEIASNKAFAPLIVASLANGGGASGSKGGSRAAAENDWTKASTKDRVALLKSKNPNLGS